MKNKILIEVCCGSVDDCLVAANNHADRIELNSALELGGLTPSLATLQLAKAKVNLPICCMVRPRTAGFVYTEIQFETMLQDATILLENGADGIVFGFLHPDNTVDKERTQIMCDLIHRYHKEAIFHKAFDQCTDLSKALDTCIACQVDRILTSGGSHYPDIEEGGDRMKAFIEQHGDQIQILPGGGVRPNNVRKILDLSKATQIHMTAKQQFDDHGSYVAVDDQFLKEILNQI